jgi:hypothetical protein
MRVSTQQSMKVRPDSHHTAPRGRGRPACTPTRQVAPIGRVTKEQFDLQSKGRASTGNPPHATLCGDLTHV